jgi:hypothetical protein
MSQHDMEVANQGFAAFRSDLNTALQALVSESSGPTEPTPSYAYQIWNDTANGLRKQRNAANSGWIIRGTLAEALVVAKSGSYTVIDDDFAKTFKCSSTFTLALTAAATLADGFVFDVRNTGSGIITIDPNSTEQIDGATTATLMPGESCRVWCDGAAFFTVGLTKRDVPQNSQSAAYTTVASDAGKHILHPSADTTARVFTIDSNANVPYPIGTAITFVNQNGAGAVTIAITSDTMRLAGAGTTGSRTLAANGIATALKVTATEWIISGTGLT